MKTSKQTEISNYIDPDGLAIQIRRAGGTAYVETKNRKDVLITNKPIKWVRRLCKRISWISV